MLNRMPRKNEKVVFNSNGMYPSADGKKYTVLGRHNGRPDILDVKQDGSDLHTQIIARFNDGYNKFLEIV